MMMVMWLMTDEGRGCCRVVVVVLRLYRTCWRWNYHSHFVVLYNMEREGEGEKCIGQYNAMDEK